MIRILHMLSVCLSLLALFLFWICSITAGPWCIVYLIGIVVFHEYLILLFYFFIFSPVPSLESKVSIHPDSTVVFVIGRWSDGVLLVQITTLHALTRPYYPVDHT